MWDKVLVPGTGVRWEKELFYNYWKTMIDYGALTSRFSNSANSAWKIIDSILKQHETDVLLLQEPVDLKRFLNETCSGKTFTRLMTSMALIERIRAISQVRRE